MDREYKKDWSYIEIPIFFVIFYRFNTLLLSLYIKITERYLFWIMGVAYLNIILVLMKYKV